MLVSLVRQRLSLRVGYFQNEFSSILALEELQQRFGKCFETLYDGHGKTSLSSIFMKDEEAKKKEAATAASVLPATAD